MTPTIGENGNWWIGDTDTGVKAAVAEESGCGSSIGFMGTGVLVAILSLGSMICIKKREEK